MAQNAIMRPLSGIARMFSAMQGRLYSAPPVTIANVNEQSWPSPLQPVQPVAPKGSQPLAFSFFQGLNLNITPRPDAPLTFADLRQLAQYPLARICIENVKDQLCSLPWSIQLRERPGESLKDRRKKQETDTNIPKLTDFFRYPDGETPWGDWLRPLLEDLLVIDAPSILIQRTLSGQVVKLRIPDGSQFLRLIDDQGFTPQGDSPAYTQLWDGIPRILLTTKQLVYRPSNIAPRNTLASQLYGFSPTEQLATEIRIGQERLRFVLAYYTEGSVPGMVHVVPNGVPPDSITEAMNALNSDLAGNLAKKRQWRMVPGFRSLDDQREEQIIQIKEPILADSFDDLHIHKIAFGYGTSPQRLLKSLNRSTAGSSQDASEKEDLYPRVQWLKGVMDLVIQFQMQQTAYEMVFDLDTELDPVKQADVDKIYVSTGIMTINEVRDDRGEEPRPEPEANQLMVITTTGALPLAGSTDRTNASADADVKQKLLPKPAPVVANPAPEPAPKKVSKKKLLKAGAVAIDSGKLTDKNLRLTKDLEHRIARWLKKSGKAIGSGIRKQYGGNKQIKADVGSQDQDNPEDKKPEILLGGAEATPIERHTAQAIALLAAGFLNWDALSDEVYPYLDSAAEDGVGIGIDQLPDIDVGIDIGATQESAAEAANRYARDRSAELIGKKRLDDGTLIDNPNAKWAISETTREDLKATIAQAIEEGWTANQLAAVIEGSGTFSSARAKLIADTEMRNAQSLGTFLAWTQSGVQVMVRWQTTEDERVCDECDGYEDQGIVPLGHQFAPGIQHPTAHPLCRCILEVVNDDK